MVGWFGLDLLCKKLREKYIIYYDSLQSKEWDGWYAVKLII